MHRGQRWSKQGFLRCIEDPAKKMTDDNVKQKSQTKLIKKAGLNIVNRII